jgi:hypothetical protein
MAKEKEGLVAARLIMLLACAAAVAAIAAGCGGSDSSASSGDEVTVTTSSLSKDEFIKQASAACTRARKNITNESISYLQQHEAKGDSRADEAASFAKMVKVVIVPIIENEIAEIQKLGAPSGDEDEIEAFLSSEQKGMKEVAKLGHIVSRFQLERYFAPSAKIGRAYGIEACVNSE